MNKTPRYSTIKALTLATYFLCIHLAVADNMAMQPDGNMGLLTTSVGGLDIDPLTGAASTTIPIEIPKGRAGIQPKLALTYNSYNKKGMAGIGWDVPVDYFERYARQGVPNYDNKDEFIFVESGVRSKLVSIGSNEYRPKIESGFRKIQFIGNSYWVVTGRDGTKSFFGQTAASRVQDPANASHVFKYLLDRVEDVHGNFMTITYTPVGGDEDRYPDEISYTGNTSGLAPYVNVKFNYSARPDQRFSYISGFKIKNGQILNSIDVKLATGELYRQYQLAYTTDTQVNQSFLTKVKQLGADGVTALPDTNFEYSTTKLDFNPPIIPTNFPADTFASGRMKMMDMNGDGRDDIVHSPQGGGPWQIYLSRGNGDFDPPVNAQNSPPMLIESWFVSASYHMQKFVDLNGDGLLDLAAIVEQLPPYGNGHMKVWINNGHQGYYPGISPLLSNEAIPGNFKNTRFMDMNNDGFTDFVVSWALFQPIPWKIYYNNGSGIFENGVDCKNTPTTSNGFYNMADIHMRYFDINGDGLLDLLQGTDIIFYNNGKDGFNPQILIQHPVQETATSTTYFADINGDGLPDRINNVLPWRAYYNLGNNDFSSAVTLNPSPQTDGSFIYYDINGDGLLDVLEGQPKGSSYPTIEPPLWKVYINNNGNGFLPPVSLSEHPIYETLSASISPYYLIDLAFGDVDGDGRLDMVYAGNKKWGASDNSNGVWLGQKDSRCAQGGVLVKISRSAGSTTDIAYKSSPIKGLPGPQYSWAYHSLKFLTVDTYAQTMSQFNKQYKTSYTYSNGLWNNVEREFRGFALVQETHPDGHVVQTNFHQDDLRKGKIMTQETFNSSNNLLTKVLNNWSTQTISPGVDFVFLSQTDKLTYQIGDTSIGRRSQEKFVYGESPQLGNQTQSIDLGEVDLNTGTDLSPTDNRLTEIIFGNNPTHDPYLVGFPQQIVKKDSVGNIMRQSWLYYDNAADSLVLPVKGLLTQKKEWGGTDPLIESPVTRFTYDPFGNITSVTDPRLNVTTMSYDSSFAIFPLTIRNALNQEESMAYYGVNGVPLNSGDGYQGLFGQLKSSTDLNNQQSKKSYDPLGRLVKDVGPLDTISLPTTQIDYTPTPNYWLVTTKQRINEGQTATLDTYQFYDGLGRLLETKTPLEIPGTFAVTGQADYNYRGQPEKQYLPFSTSNSGSVLETLDDSRPHSAMSYDALGRVTETVNPDGKAQSVLYKIWDIITTDENGHQKIQYADAHARPTKVEDYTGADGRSGIYPSSSFLMYGGAVYSYDSEDLLKNIVDAQNHVTTILYDGLGRKKLLKDPSMGAGSSWLYGYDAAGNLLSQTDPQGQTLDMAYDKLNRISTKKDHASSGVAYNVLYNYDTYADSTIPYGKGRLTKTTYQTQGSGQNIFYYDQLGREIKLTKTIDGTDYTVRRSYDALDRLKAIDYPDSGHIDYIYNAAGQIEQVKGSTAPAVTQSKVIGYNRTLIPVNSDALLAVAFTQKIEGTFTVSAKSLTGVSIADTLTAGAFAGAYYVRFTSGNGAGLWSTITGNGANDFTLEDARVLSFINPGDSFRVYKHQTLGSLFPAALYGVSYTNGTKVLFYKNNLDAMVQSPSAEKTATYAQSSGAWVGSGVNNNTIVKPETRFIVRNASASPLTMIMTGDVPDYAVSLLLAPNGDLVIGSGYPVPVLLNSTGLAGPGSTGNLRKVLFFNNDATGQNKSAIKTASYFNGSWVGAGVTPSEVLNPSESFTLRMPAGDPGIKATITAPYMVNATTSVDNLSTTVVGGMLQISFSTAIGLNYNVEYSNDLLGWTPLWTADKPGTGGQLSLSDALAQHRFYRVRVTTPAKPIIYISNVNYNAAGQVEKIEYGNGVITDYSYYSTTLRLKRIKTAKAAVTIQDLNYTYDDAGNLRTISDAVNPASNQTFAYDELNRLTQASGSYGAKVYAYDTIGNIKIKDGLNYNYAASVGLIHAVTSLQDGRAFTYDNNSNMQTRTESGVTTQYTYDLENRLVDIKKANLNQAQYGYDGDGIRTRKTNFVIGSPSPALAPDTTRYVDDLYEKSTSGREVEHIYLGGQRVASLVNGQPEFIHADHLGGANVVTDAGGSVKQAMAYDPYGKITRHIQKGTDNELARHYFTGQEFDGEAGLYYYGARHYDPVLGIFLQADSIVQDPLNPQTLNRHAYALNNPVNRIDPSGNESLGMSDKKDTNKSENSDDSNPGSGNAGSGGSSSNIDLGRIFIGAPRTDVIAGASQGSQQGMGWGGGRDRSFGSGLEGVHDSLNAVGMIPGYGEVPNAVNAGLYAVQGDWGNAGMSVVAMVPFVGAVGNVGTKAVKTSKYWQYFTKGWKDFKSEWFVKGINGKPPYKLGKEAREALNLPKANKATAVQPYKPTTKNFVGPRRPKPQPDWDPPINSDGNGWEYYDGSSFPD